MVDCPACKRSHGKLSPGIYECPCKAQFRVEKNPAYGLTPSQRRKLWPKKKKADSDFFEVKYARTKSGPISVAQYKSLEDAKKFLADIKKDGWNGIITKGGKPVKNPEELSDPEDHPEYHIFASWDKERTWDVLTGPGRKGMGGERLGEVTYVRYKGGGGRFTASKVTGESRTPGFISRSDAIRWVVGELPNPAKNPAGEEPVFMGYGGSDEDSETRVYSYRGEEIRIPLHPDRFPPGEVEKEYGVISGSDLDEAVERLDEIYEDLRNPMGRTKPKLKHSPYDRAQRRARKTARTGAPASGGNGAYPSPKMRRDNPEVRLERTLGIKNASDLDKWIQEHPQTTKKGPHKGEKFLMSRYGALKYLVGEKAADRMMQELMVQSWDMSLPKKNPSPAGFPPEPEDPNSPGFIPFNQRYVDVYELCDELAQEAKEFENHYGGMVWYKGRIVRIDTYPTFAEARDWALGRAKSRYGEEWFEKNRVPNVRKKKTNQFVAGNKDGGYSVAGYNQIPRGKDVGMEMPMNWAYENYGNAIRAQEEQAESNPAKKVLERGDPGVRALHFRRRKDAHYLGKALRERYGVKRTKVVWLDSPDRGWFLLWEESPMTKGGLPWWSTGRAVGADRKSNPDAPEGYWDYAPLEVGAGDVGHPDRPVEGTQSYFDDDEWMDMVGPDTGSSNGHIADPFTPRRHFGMFTFKGNRAVELFAQRWRDRFLAEESGDTLFATGEFLTELEQLASLPGLSEASDTDVEERIISYILEGDKVVEMDGETYHYPHMVTPDYYSEPADEY